MQPVKRKDAVFRSFVSCLKKDERVSGIFITGSAKSGSRTVFSDFDVWVVFSKESGINSFRADIPRIAASAALVRGIYECTHHHYFIVYAPSIQMDMNLITSAQFFSIKNSKKFFLFDRKILLERRQPLTHRERRRSAANLLFQGNTTLERCASKFLKSDYFVAVKFLDTIREDCVIPLLNMSGSQKIKSPLGLRVSQLESGLRDVFIETYARPIRESCLGGIKAMSLILSQIADKLKIAGLDDYKKKFSKLH